MSKILALDTSTDACSVALSSDGEVVERFILTPRGHTQALLPMVDRLLAEHQLSLAQLDAIAFGCGPGSFTGLRICIGVVQGLAFGAGLPVLPVSTLRAMAAGAFRSSSQLLGNSLLVALDARMSEVYWGLFRQSEQQLVAVTQEFVQAPEDISAQLVEHQRSLLSAPLAGVGSGWHYQALQPLAPVVTDLECYPHAYDIAELALQDWQSGGAVDVLDAQPVYLRDQVSWQKRQKKRPDSLV